MRGAVLVLSRESPRYIWGVMSRKFSATLHATHNPRISRNTSRHTMTHEFTRPTFTLHITREFPATLHAMQ
ncbi:MAG: hypothetical protein IJP89_04615 [Synergistaceae bacterium]|nr:hypothetical protein [Synergistaceae bacterium]